jgi:hypothetical protein
MEERRGSTLCLTESYFRQFGEEEAIVETIIALGTKSMCGKRRGIYLGVSHHMILLETKRQR